MIDTKIQDVVVKGIVLHDGKILIVKRSDEDEFGAGTWEFVGGKIEFEEDLETALVRETKEEAGLDITIDRILYATSFLIDHTRKVIQLKYLCTSETHEVVISHEHSDYMWATKEQLEQYLPSQILADLEKNNVISLLEMI